MVFENALLAVAEGAFLVVELRFGRLSLIRRWTIYITIM